MDVNLAYFGYPSPWRSFVTIVANHAKAVEDSVSTLAKNKSVLTKNGQVLDTNLLLGKKK
jgi:hypothetical protein